MTGRGSKSLRRGRYSEANRIYLVTAVVNERKDVFSDFFAGRIVVSAMRHEDASGHLQSLAYVIMPDHFHWLVQLGETANLSTSVGRVKSMSARIINKRLKRGGRLWQDGFHDHAVRKDEDLVHLARYVVANPLRAGLVATIRDYPLWDAKWL